jgi:hypothetical protein
MLEEEAAAAADAAATGEEEKKEEAPPKDAKEFKEMDFGSAPNEVTPLTTHRHSDLRTNLPAAGHDDRIRPSLDL